MTDIFKQFLTSTQTKNAVRQADAAAVAMAEHCDARIGEANGKPTRLREALKAAEGFIQEYAADDKSDDEFLHARATLATIKSALATNGSPTCKA